METVLIAAVIVLGASLAAVIAVLALALSVIARPAKVEKSENDRVWVGEMSRSFVAIWERGFASGIQNRAPATHGFYDTAAGKEQARRDYFRDGRKDFIPGENDNDAPAPEVPETIGIN